MPGNPRARLIGGDAECDLCGRDVRRETAVEHLQRAGDGFEMVVVCPECETGTD